MFSAYLLLFLLLWVKCLELQQFNRLFPLPKEECMFLLISKYLHQFVCFIFVQDYKVWG